MQEAELAAQAGALIGAVGNPLGDAARAASPSGEAGSSVASDISRRRGLVAPGRHLPAEHWVHTDR